MTDLTRDDFVILDDGVRQAVAHFSLQTLTAATPEPDAARALLRKVPTASLEPQTRRTFVIVLGRGRLQQPSKALDRLIGFVKQELLPQDMVAVMGWNRATNFTIDHGKIVQVLERFKKYHDGVESKMALRFSGLAAMYGSEEIPIAGDTTRGRRFSRLIARRFSPTAASRRRASTSRRSRTSR